jgi:hypothetical protein
VIEKAGRKTHAAVRAGANVLVSGMSVFGADKDLATAMESLRDAVMQVAQ